MLRHDANKLQEFEVTRWVFLSLMYIYFVFWASSRLNVTSFCKKNRSNFIKSYINQLTFADFLFLGNLPFLLLNFNGQAANEPKQSRRFIPTCHLWTSLFLLSTENAQLIPIYVPFTNDRANVQKNQRAGVNNNFSQIELSLPKNSLVFTSRS